MEHFLSSISPQCKLAHEIHTREDSGESDSIRTERADTTNADNSCRRTEEIAFSLIDDSLKHTQLAVPP